MLMRLLYAFPCFLVFFLTAQISLAQQQLPIRFAWGAEYLPENYEDVRRQPGISADELVNGYYVRLIQFQQIPAHAQRAGIEALGVQFMGYVRENAYLVALPAAFDLGALAPLQARAVAPLRPEWKLARSLREPPYGAWAVHGDRIDVQLMLHPFVAIGQGAAWLRERGATVLQEGNSNGYLLLRIRQDQILEIAALPYVQYLELMPQPGEPEDLRGRSMHRANLLDSDSPLGLQFDGAGVSALVRDDGQVGPHIDFQGRLTNLSNDNDPEENHGDGVAGILGGAGNLDPANRGMAAGARIFASDYVANFQDANTLSLHFFENVTVTNSSYSDGCNDGYTINARTVDVQMDANPTFMHVFSAGNMGTSNCNYGAGAGWGNITGGHKMAKNSIAVANLNADITLAGTSSRGPAHDGRLKPDLAAHGQGQVSTDFGYTYQTFGGTSAAAPGVAGVIAQLTQAYRQQYNGEDPPAALLKLALQNTAVDLGNTGPDFRFGWGHLHTLRAWKLLEQGRWQQGQCDQNGNITHTVTVPPGVREARFMLYWSEEAALTLASQTLINDLDLTAQLPGGAVRRPWLLDPTPDPAKLNLPATTGRDSLNNTEQVAILNPEPGVYTLTIQGTAVPLGPQPYFIAWEFITDDIKLVYPAGGESLVGSVTERIHWDAHGNQGDFELSYSTNDGQSWTTIATIPANRRYFDWGVPNLISPNVRLLLTRGAQRDTSDLPFSIAPNLSGVTVVRVCPDSITLSCQPISDTLRYDAYLLGAQKMEIRGSAYSNTVTFPAEEGGNPFWYSMRLSHPNGLTGRRARAQFWEGGLKLCPQTHDLAATKLQSPQGNAVFLCGTTTKSVSVRLENTGQDTLAGAQAYYQVDNDAPVAQAVPALAPGASIDLEFQTPLNLSGVSQLDLKVWVEAPGDIARFNDTLEQSFAVIAQTASAYFKQGFEGNTFPPANWRIDNPDNDLYTWDRTNQPIPGPQGNDLTTNALFLSCIDYEQTGREDLLYMVPVNLAAINNPALTFDLAHARYNNSTAESLRVELFPACNFSGQPIVIWQKTDPELATASNNTLTFVPENETDWRNEVVNLNPWSGQTVLLRFVSTNDFGNNIYLDNIGIVAYNPQFPNVPAINTSDASICRLDTVTFSIPTQPAGTTVTWQFGTGAQPTSATGIGPHAVRYLSAGNKNVRVIAENAFGADTVLLSYPVQAPATANFTFAAADQTVTFTSTSTNATTHLWSFGDGATSTEVNPVHTYAAPGSYNVQLDVSNLCGVKTVTKNVTLSVGTSNLAEQLGLRIWPNPTGNDFNVAFNSNGRGPVRLQLLDATGKLMHVREAILGNGPLVVPFENLGLAKGIYQLHVQTEQGVQTFKIAVQ